MDLKDIRQILDLVREHELSEFELEREGFKIRIKKGTPVNAPGAFAVPLVQQPAAAPPQPPASAAPAPLEAVPGPASLATDEVDFAIVKSPIVGTFFRSAEPGALPFVDVGDTVRKGQVLCIIEAMKLMNEIESEFDGVVEKVYIENGQPVQFNDRLFAIRKA